jgi:hypothetical protein
MSSKVSKGSKRPVFRILFENAWIDYVLNPNSTSVSEIVANICTYFERANDSDLCLRVSETLELVTYGMSLLMKITWQT